MCGIAGFTWSDRAAAERVSAALAHRGPDSSGTADETGLTLVHRRLSILDLSPAGSQPMYYGRETGGCSRDHHAGDVAQAPVGIVYNGEIYNYREVERELSSKGYAFRTRCDTELILAAYLEWGPGCVTRFNGMWTFCILDRRERKLFLSRDRMGIKPLYVHQKDGQFAFASELKAFAAMGVRDDIDDEALRLYLLFGFIPAPHSIYRHVRKLRSGHNLIYDLATATVVSDSAYWDAPFTSDERIRPAEAREEIRRLVDDAVRLRLLADVPVGAFLSGGLDSSIVVHAMRQHTGSVKTFSIRFDHPDFDESPWARCVARHLGTEHHEIAFAAGDVKRLIEVLPRYYDEPFGDSSMIPTYLVSQVARQHVTVCLSGTGGDELFAGYPRYRELLALRRLRKWPGPLLAAAAGAYGCVNPDRGGKLRELLRPGDDEALYLKLFSHLFRNVEEPFRDLAPAAALREHLRGPDELARLLSFDQRVYLPDDLLVKEDRATMAHSLEGRVPLIDYRLVRFANTLPSRMKLVRGSGKHILKQAYEGLLPRAVIHRRKQGFGLPLAHYLRTDLREFAHAVLFDSSASLLEPLAAGLRVTWERHQTGRSDYSPLLWNAMMLARWQQEYARQ